jgi:hypothetical protein
LSPVSTDFEADRSSSNISENRFFFKLTNSFIDIEHEHGLAAFQYERTRFGLAITPRERSAQSQPQ